MGPGSSEDARVGCIASHRSAKLKSWSVNWVLSWFMAIATDILRSTSLTAECPKKVNSPIEEGSVLLD